MSTRNVITDKCPFYEYMTINLKLELETTVAQNRQTKSLALERAFHLFMAPDGHRSLSYTLGKGENHRLCL